MCLQRLVRNPPGGSLASKWNNPLPDPIWRCFAIEYNVQDAAAAGGPGSRWLSMAAVSDDSAVEWILGLQNFMSPAALASTAVPFSERSLQLRQLHSRLSVAALRKTVGGHRAAGQHGSTAGQARIDRWLATFGLHDCAAPLAAAGYETMDDLFALQLGPGDDTLMSEHALISAGVASYLDRATLLKHLKAASRWQAALAQSTPVELEASWLAKKYNGAPNGSASVFSWLKAVHSNATKAWAAATVRAPAAHPPARPKSCADLSRLLKVITLWYEGDHRSLTGQMCRRNNRAKPGRQRGCWWS